MTRSPEDDPLPVSGTLTERIRSLLAQFDGETKGYAFDDSGDGTRYATWMADLLEESLTAMSRTIS